MSQRTERGRAGQAARALPTLGGVRLGGFALNGPDVLGWLGANCRREVEQRRLFPWLAVAYGAGILLAFAAESPPSIWPPALASVASAGGAFLMRARLAVLAPMLALTLVFSGFAATLVRMALVDAPVLPTVTVTRVGGFVESVEERIRGGRLVVLVDTAEKLAPEIRPQRVRVTVRALDGVAPGDYIQATMRLLPPPEAARPGGYDFARDAYFRGIGAVGSVSGRLARIEPPPASRSLGLQLAAAVDRARNALTTRIAGTIGGSAGAVAAALITGKRGLIDDHTNDILRAAGIYHVVSISGLHMVLAAGVFFWITRAFLALSPAAALRWPIKKLAAVAGMIGATAYDVFSGSDVATERSLCMILVMQGAILFDRPALSLRNLAISALIVLTREPETLLGPSLQMSYAAVAGLIAMAEWQRGRARAVPEETHLGRGLRWAATIMIGTVATTIVASIATGPFGTYHFQNLQPYGVIGNAVTLPLVSLAVMPAAVLGVVAFAFGLDRPIWTMMGWAVEAVLWLSERVSGIAGSVVIVPAFGVSALALFVVAILLATLCVSGLRWLALGPAVLGLWAAAASPRNDVYIARDGSSAAIRTATGRLTLVGRPPDFVAEQWLRADGDARKPGAADLRTGARCDPIGCTVQRGAGRIVAFVADRRGFEADCRRATIVVSRLTAPPDCRARLVIDRAFLLARGTTAIRFGPEEPIIDTTRRPGETRPWFAQDRSPAAGSSKPMPSTPMPFKPKPSKSEPSKAEPSKPPLPTATSPNPGSPNPGSPNPGSPGAASSSPAPPSPASPRAVVPPPVPGSDRVAPEEPAPTNPGGSEPQAPDDPDEDPSDP